MNLGVHRGLTILTWILEIGPGGKEVQGLPGGGVPRVGTQASLQTQKEKAPLARLLGLTEPGKRWGPPRSHCLLVPLGSLALLPGSPHSQSITYAHCSLLCSHTGTQGRQAPDRTQQRSVQQRKRPFSKSDTPPLERKALLPLPVVSVQRRGKGKDCSLRLNS